MGYTNVKVFAEGYPAWKIGRRAASAGAQSAKAAPPSKPASEEGSIDHRRIQRDHRHRNPETRLCWWTSAMPMNSRRAA
jgi:hypothetical protein